MNYYKIQYATLCIRENPGCMFIATNRDAVTHLTDAQEWAGNGSMVGAIMGSTKQEPTTVGKPAEFMLDNIASQFNLKKEQICMVRRADGSDLPAPGTQPPFTRDFGLLAAGLLVFV